MDRVVQWLTDLVAVAPTLRLNAKPKPYWSQRRGAQAPAGTTHAAAAAQRARRAVQELHDEHFFAETLGFDCVDGNGDTDATPESELADRVGKPHLWASDPGEWHEDDLCDFIEVFHDLAARPVDGWFHSFSGCGWHPTGFSRKSGQALYQWRVNEILDASLLGLRLADDGEDVGRMVRAAPGELETLVTDVLASTQADPGDVAHAVALFRSRAGSRQERRSAVVTLHRILESRRALLKTELLRKDEGVLFQIANEFDLRHHRDGQRGEYRQEFLDWVFYWYLATIQLTDQLLKA